MSNSENLTPVEARKLLEEGRLHVYRWEDDDVSQRFAADQARLPYDRLTSQEAGCFPDLLDNKTSCQLFLYIRNKILQMWFLEPNVELTANDVYHQMIVPYNSDRSLINRVHGFLQRYGFINFGIFHRLRNTPNLSEGARKKIIVIGGGVAGLAATRQLIYFGFDVILLEAKGCCGGRTLSYTVKTATQTEHADLGATYMHSIKGNPITTLLKQIDCHPYEVNCECPLYDDTGKLVESSKERLVNEAFKRLVDLNNFMHNDRVLKKPDGSDFNLEETCLNLMDILELKMQKKRREFWELYEEVLGKLIAVKNEVKIYTRLIDDLTAQPKSSEVDKIDPTEDKLRLPFEIDARCRNRDLVESVKRLENAVDRYNNLETTLRDMKRQEPSSSDCYMNARDKKLMHFHMAIYEGKYGAPLSDLSAKDYNQSESYFGDKHCIGFKEGYGNVMNKLLTGIGENVRTHSEVTKIDYTPKGVTVKYKNTRGECDEVEETADCVLVTVPLGVLKKITSQSESAMVFNPPLPDKHIEAITRIGSGALNKIVMIFDRCFWNTETQFFGHLNKQKHDRGEMYLFCSSPGSLILTALMSGHSARLRIPNHVIVKQCVMVLQKIFGVNVPQPVECIITRWDEDPHILTALSYIPPGSDGSYLDTLGESVAPIDEEGKRNGEPRLFFAGEHTSKEFHATVQGAWLSGVREAAKIADQYIGCSFSRNSMLNPECITLDDDNEDGRSAMPELRKNPMRPHLCSTLRLPQYMLQHSGTPGVRNVPRPGEVTYLGPINHQRPKK